MTRNAAQKMTTAALTLSLAGCGALNSVRDKGRQMESTLPLNSTHVDPHGGASFTGSMPAQSIATPDMSVVSQTPQTYVGVPGITYISPKDLRAENVKVTTPAGTFEAALLIATNSEPMKAFVAQLAELAKWVDSLSKAQMARDTAQQKVASDAIVAILQGLLKLAVP